MLQQNIYDCSGFYGGIREGYNLLVYEAASVDNRLSNFPSPEYEDLRNLQKPGSA